MQVPGIDPARARALFKAGIERPEQVAGADPVLLKKALATAMPRIMQAKKSVKGTKGGTVQAAQVCGFP